MMSLPNYITILRVVLIPFFIDFMVYGYFRAALIVFIVAGLTDALDGMAARLMKSRTELGAFLDPMADKLLIVSAFVTLALLDMLPVWLVIIVVSRDIILALGSLILYVNGFDIKVRPSLVGKSATVLQLSVVVLTLFFIVYGVESRFMPVLFWMTAAATVGSGLQYILRGMKLTGGHGSKAA